MIHKILELFEKRNYKFVALSNAQSDPAYSIPDTFITQYDPMWGYRWAKVRNVPVDGKLEPEPAQWVFDYIGRVNKRGSLAYALPSLSSSIKLLVC